MRNLLEYKHVDYVIESRGQKMDYEPPYSIFIFYRQRKMDVYIPQFPLSIFFISNDL